jgi:hypothetical protein
MKNQLSSDFDIKCITVQFHGNSHNSQSDRWIELTFYVESPNRLSYLGVTFQKGITILVNKGCMNFVIYFLLTYELPIWLGFFSYKDVTACFGNLLALQGSLMSCNIVFKCGKGYINVRIIASMFIVLLSN